MRIGLLTTSFPRTPDDSAGAFVLGFAQALAARGHRLHVLAPESSEPMTVTTAAPNWPGVVVEPVPYLRPRSWQRTFYGAGVPDNVRNDPRAYLGLAPFSLLLTQRCRQRAHEWDAVVSHWALPCALAAGLGCPQLPHLAVLHSADVHWLARLPLGRTLALRIAKQARALWFVAHVQQRRFLELLPRPQRASTEARCIVAPMGVTPPPAPLSASERERVRAQLGLQRFSVLALGRLVPIKGLDTVIAALAGHATQGMTLVIAGAGPERARLAQLASAHGTDVRFVGHVSGEHKAQLLAATDAYVLASRTLPGGRTEGLPHALLEAMAHGLPVVATQVGGLADFAHDQLDALLVPEGDPLRLRQALLRLRDDAALRNRIASQGHVLAQQYHWPQLAPRIEACLRT